MLAKENKIAAELTVVCGHLRSVYILYYLLKFVKWVQKSIAQFYYLSVYANNKYTKGEKNEVS